MNGEEEDTLSKKNIYRAMLDKNSSILVKETSNRMFFILKKDLIDYKMHVFASEAPISNFILSDEITEFETVIADKSILEKEVFPFQDKIAKIFKRSLDLISVRLCVGQEDDHVTIDENDLKKVDIKPSIQGLKEFLLTNRSVIGFSVRKFDTKKGNLIFLETKLNQAFEKNEIKTIRMKIIASLQQRGLYMQKHHRPFGLQMYIVINLRKRSDEISPETISILKQLGIPIDNIQFRRNVMVSNWQAIECELRQMNLCNYLQNQFPKLSHSDVSQIARFCQINDLGFDVSIKMATILSKSKEERYSKKDQGTKFLNENEITAAGIVAAEYFGIQNIEVEKELGHKLIRKYYDEFNDYV